MINVLITGASGFIGTNLVNKLSKISNIKVFCISRMKGQNLIKSKNITILNVDYSKTPLLKKIILEKNINIIYHLAWASIPETASNNPEKDILVNVIPTINLMDACLETNVKKFIFISSGGTIYGNSNSFPIKETNDKRPINAYGISKLSVENYLEMYNHIYDFDYMIFRPSNPYGPFQHPKKNLGAVSIFMYKALMKENITIWGDGKIIRDYFFIDDMISALLGALNFNSRQHNIFNLSGLKAYSLNEIVYSIEETLKIKLNVNYRKNRQCDVKKVILDSSLAKKYLGWSPIVGLEEGLHLTRYWLEQKFKI
jgi:UDP-glucose 4-epimerase